MVLKWSTFTLMLLIHLFSHERVHCKPYANSTAADEKDKRFNPGTVIPPVIAAASLGVDVLGKVLDALGSVERKIAIGIANKTPYEWEALNVYFQSGTSDEIPPESVQPNKALLYGARKTNGPVARGSVGVITYYMKGTHKTLAVLFSVPFDYNLYSNYWDAKVYSGKKYASYSMYNWLYYGNPLEGNDRWRQKSIGNGFGMRGVMTSGGSCKLQMRVYKLRSG